MLKISIFLPMEINSSTKKHYKAKEKGEFIMLCPRCGNVLRASKKSTDYLLCDTCKKKIKIENALPEDDWDEDERSHAGLIIVGIVLTILIIALIVVFVFYGRKKEEIKSSENLSGTEESNGDSSELESLGDVEVDDGLFNVTITVPSDFMGDTTQEELEAAAAETGYKVTFNEDGSVTYVMTKKQHQQMLDDIAADINASLADMVGSEEYPNITEVTSNDDFTEFTVTTKNAEPDLSESFSSMAFYMYSGFYHIFEGHEVDNVHVDFVNADSGEVIGSADSRDFKNMDE